MVHYPFEYRAKCEPVMPAECCGESKNWDSVLSRTAVGIDLLTLDFRVKEGQYATISEYEVRYYDRETNTLFDIRRGRSVVGFVDYYGLETFRREFVQAAGLKQSLVCCDGPFLTFDSRSPRK